MSLISHLYQLVSPQEIVQHVTPQIIAPDHAVRLRASQDLLDKDGIHRATGEEWLVRDIGAYLPGVFEEVGQWVDCGCSNSPGSVCRPSCSTFQIFLPALCCLQIRKVGRSGVLC